MFVFVNFYDGADDENRARDGGILLTVTNVRGRKSMLITVKIRILSP